MQRETKQKGLDSWLYVVVVDDISSEKEKVHWYCKYIYVRVCMYIVEKTLSSILTVESNKIL